MERFDEHWYLSRYADVKAAIEAGAWPSAYAHFAAVGRAEGRLPGDPQVHEANQDLVHSQFTFDAFFVTTDGAALLIGWIDDRSDRLIRLSIDGFGSGSTDLASRLNRYRRDDVSNHKGVPVDVFDFGTWVGFDGLARASFGVGVEIQFGSGRAAEEQLRPVVLAPADLLGRMLEAVSWLQIPSGTSQRPDVTAGAMLRQLNRQVLSRTIVAAPLRHGGSGSVPTLSIVISPVHAVDELRRQLAFIAAAPGIDRVELIYANSHRNEMNDFFAFVEFAYELHHVNVVAVAMSEAPGLARTRNEAAAAASGGTLLFLDPCVFPGDRDWLGRTLRLSAAIGEREVVGGVLLHEDDSVRHGPHRLRRSRRPGSLWEVADGPFGSPRHLDDALIGAPTVAVGGGAMLIPRPFFTELGGFHEDYILGGYEDFDLCFRARAAGGSVRLDPTLVFYDLGSPITPAQSSRDGAMRINQALFNERWGSELESFDLAAHGAAGERLGSSPRQLRRRHHGRGA
jgi:GT2 family glycosyltransferase